MTALPLIFRWDGEAMVPHGPRWAKEADKQFVIGELYRLIPHEERSAKSHAHFFAAIGTAWASLPEPLASQFPSADHLRKFLLIKAGWCNEDKIVLDSPTDALAVAAYARRRDGYAVVTVSGNVVTTYTARSQDYKSQNKKEFQDTKDRVFTILAEMTGSDASSIEDAARTAA